MVNIVRVQGLNSNSVQFPRRYFRNNPGVSGKEVVKLATIASAVTTEKVEKFKMYIDGEWVPAESGETFEVRSPVTGALIGEVPLAGSADVKKAIDAAYSAKQKIASIPVYERFRMMERLVEYIKADFKKYAWEITREQGKPITEAYGEMQEAAPNVMEVAEAAKKIETSVYQSLFMQDTRIISVREPLGVVSCIMPWNFPWLIPIEAVPQAVMCGNSVVFKPAEGTPIGGIRLVECMEKAGIPKGVINMVTGGPEVGKQLVSNPKVDAVCAVGETTTGIDIAKNAPLKRLTLELGGNGPLIVLDDANLERAVEASAYGCCYNAGQVCVSNERILVHERVYETYVKKLVDRMRTWKLGDPFKEETKIGPMNNEPGVQKVEEHLRDGVDKGAKVLLGGKRATGFPTKLYFEPTVIVGVTEDMLLNKKETFGPVAPVIKFSTMDEAIDIANGTEYGLSSAVFTNNLKRAFHMAEHIKAGQIVINDTVCCWEYLHPWGGVKGSGIGRMGGRHTVEALTELKSISFNLGKSDM
jgi:acyl-CoA reductase-like NAD-dependent aldehyde dehydrogenase